MTSILLTYFTWACILHTKSFIRKKSERTRQQCHALWIMRAAASLRFDCLSKSRKEYEKVLQPMICIKDESTAVVVELNLQSTKPLQKNNSLSNPLSIMKTSHRCATISARLRKLRARTRASRPYCWRTTCPRQQAFVKRTVTVV
jgi:hypothetical protein